MKTVYKQCVCRCNMLDFLILKFKIMIDYLTCNLWLMWTLVCVAALILEVSSGTFYLVCFAIGAVGAVVFSLMDAPLWLQVLVFSLVSAISVFCIRPLLLKCVSGASRKSY